ncbi:MAG: pyridoxal phosphate-dependent aminotransferase [Clostridia bacterium]|nr:pyridoxal phosphate-dependent aminotransferase [Clostridia bacterium]
MFSEKICRSLASGSMIRAMFEQGSMLKAKYGEENVYDFALGNPDPEPDKEIIDDIIALADEPGIHKYMSNAGFADVRSTVAAHMSEESGREFTADEIVMVTGAAAGLSVTFHSLLDPGDEVITLAPYFMEYNSYVGNQGGTVKPVNTLPDTFRPDIPAIAAAIGPRTKAIILNSPNNPSGAVYPEEDLEALRDVLDEAEKRTGNPVYVVSDEPYAKIVYDGVKVPSVARIFKNSITVNSFSKSLALPGERIGYIAVNPDLPDKETLEAALVYSNRTLGFVNAPSLFQKVAARHLDRSVGLDAYKERRDMLYEIVTDAGFKCLKPQGAFYLFPKSPIPDDKKFAEIALRHRTIVVAGSGFSYPGYFRLAYCVSRGMIKRSAGAFREIMAEIAGGTEG